MAGQRTGLRRCAAAGIVMLFGTPAWAADPPKIDAGDTAWMLVATALVLMMTLPGLALFYGGMVRKKNVLATMTQSLGCAALVSVLWVLVGYSLVFSGDGRFIGDLEHVLLRGIGIASVHDNAKTVPETVYMMFQMTFAIITPALIVGAVADRLKFSAMLWLLGLWLLLVYCPIAHWVWGGGFLQKQGVLDYAGGIVVHINAGVAGLVAALYMGRRHNYGHENMAPHNMVLTVTGVALLWVGWFGFNAGSAGAADGRAGMAMTVTHISAAMGALGWMGAEWAIYRKPSVLGLASGVVAGLGTITPASGYVGVEAALIIGLVAGVVCFWASTNLKRKLGYDDSLDVFGVHGVGGVIGTLAVGIFAVSAIAGPDVSGLIEGSSQQLASQALGAVCAIAWSGVMTWVILKVVDVVVGLRVPVDAEVEGLDQVLHGEQVH